MRQMRFYDKNSLCDQILDILPDLLRIYALGLKLREKGDQASLVAGLRFRVDLEIRVELIDCVVGEVHADVGEVVFAWDGVLFSC
jgi:hypothetical protein